MNLRRLLDKKARSAEILRQRQHLAAIQYVFAHNVPLSTIPPESDNCNPQSSHYYLSERMRALSTPQGAGFDPAGDMGVNAEAVVGEHFVKVVVEKQAAVGVKLNEIHGDTAHKFVL